MRDLTTEDTEGTELKACVKTHAKEILAGFSSEELWRNYAEALEILCRKLERERDEARKHLAAANKGAEINAHINNSLTAKLAEAKRERDEARALVDRLHVAFEGRCRATYEWYFTQGSDVREAALQFLYPEHFK